MHRDPGVELLEACEAARRAGADFPTVWNRLLKNHRHVTGAPVSHIRDGEAVLEVPLAFGRTLCCGQNGYSLR